MLCHTNGDRHVVTKQYLKEHRSEGVQFNSNRFPVCYI